MRNLEIVNRKKSVLTIEGTITVKKLKKLLTAVGYNICGKTCYITKNNVTKPAEDSYVLDPADAIMFDSVAPKRPVTINVTGDNCDIHCNDNNVTISYR